MNAFWALLRKISAPAADALTAVLLAPPTAGLSGGSAISPQGWRFMICAEPERCQEDPTDGLSRWYRCAPRVEGGIRWQQAACRRS